MSEILTKSTARNIFYGGSAFFFAIFVALTAQSHFYIVKKSTDSAHLTEAVERGKRVWERNACFDCHTIYGEGARFAPEVGDVFRRWGGDKDPVAAKQMIKDWMKSQPSGVAGRRQMPNFNLTEDQLSDLAEFLAWASATNTQGWPPHDAK